MEQLPQQTDNSGRNPDGTFAPGHEKIEGSGRPKNTLKDYVRRKLSGMSDKEKEDYLRGIPRDLQWQMAEGRPQQDVTSAGEKLNPIPIYGGQSVPGHDGDPKDIRAPQAD